MQSRARALIALAVVGLSGCGGGSTASTPLAQVPAQLALSQILQRGYTEPAAVSGSAQVNGTTQPVTGTATLTQSPAKLTTFNGQPAFVVTSTTTGSALIGGQPLPIASTTQSYYTLGFAPLGTTTADGATCAAPNAGAYPATVSAGQSGAVASYTCTGTNGAPAGSASISFSTAPGSNAASVLFTLNQQLLDPLGVPVGNLQVRYAMDTNGNVAVVYQLQVLVLGGIPLTLGFTVQSSG